MMNPGTRTLDIPSVYRDPMHKWIAVNPLTRFALPASTPPRVESRGTDLAVTIIGFAFAGFCIWLTVRIVNRHERRTKWILAVVVGMTVLYFASFGPACRLIGEGYLPINSP
jgi:hypothetical protein